MTDIMNPNLTDDWPYPLFLIDRESETISWANQAAQEWTETSIRKLTGKRPWDVFKADADAQEIVSKCQEINSPVTMRDCPIALEEQEDQFCHMMAYPAENGIGLCLWFVGSKPRQSRIGGKLVSGMGRMIAHELKNPLAGIKGAAQLLRDDVESAEGRSLLDLISSEIDRIRRLADRMETLGDQDPDNSERVNIHELLRQARRIIQSANPKLIFTEHYDPSLPHASGDADTLMQALLNIIKNASEALSGADKGEIILETRFRSGVSSVNEKSSRNLPIEIRVIDNGPGVADDIKDQLFQPFVTNKPEGQGLGLALVSKVASAHGGIVEVSSRPGRTKFSLLLPVLVQNISGDLNEI